MYLKLWVLTSVGPIVRVLKRLKCEYCTYLLNVFAKWLGSQIHLDEDCTLGPISQPIVVVNTCILYSNSAYGEQGPKFYNSLNSVITGSSSSTSFKRKLKEFPFSMY